MLRSFERALTQVGAGQGRQARRFAQATGQLAKTDSLDAKLLARMGAVLEIEPRLLIRETLADLKELHVAWQALVKDRTSAKNRAHALTPPSLKKQNEQSLVQIDRQLEKVEDAIRTIILSRCRLRAKLRDSQKHSRPFRRHRFHC